MLRVRVAGDLKRVGEFSHWCSSFREYTFDIQDIGVELLMGEEESWAHLLLQYSLRLNE
jgi:hypothetical protein